jgi:hypothetical protein
MICISDQSYTPRPLANIELVLGEKSVDPNINNDGCQSHSLKSYCGAFEDFRYRLINDETTYTEEDYSPNYTSLCLR